MFCPEEMKLNKFQNVRIPSGEQLFSRFGLVNAQGTHYTGDEYEPINRTKLQNLEDLQAYDKMMQKEEAKAAAEAARQAEKDAEILKAAKAAKTE